MRAIILTFLLIIFSSCSKRPSYQPDIQEEIVLPPELEADFQMGVKMNYKMDYKCELKPRDQIRYSVIDLTSQQVYEKFGIYCCGEGAATDEECNFKQLQMIFETDQPMTKDEGTETLLKIIKIFLQNINHHPEIQPYLCCHPFTIQNVNVRLVIRNQAYPQPFAIGFSSGTIRYFYENENNKITSIDESYEDMIRRLNISEDQLQ